MSYTDGMTDLEKTRIQTRYGVYYVYGNHDRQPYTRNKNYTDEELANAIENRVSVLHMASSGTRFYSDVII